MEQIMTAKKPAKGKATLRPKVKRDTLAEDVKVLLLRVAAIQPGIAESLHRMFASLLVEIRSTHQLVGPLTTVLDHVHDQIAEMQNPLIGAKVGEDQFQVLMKRCDKQDQQIDRLINLMFEFVQRDRYPLTATADYLERVRRQRRVQEGNDYMAADKKVPTLQTPRETNGTDN
jgi:hypothetical protein